MIEVYSPYPRGTPCCGCADRGTPATTIKTYQIFRLRPNLIIDSENTRARSDRRLLEVGVALREVVRRQEGAGHDPGVGDLLPLGRLICERGKQRAPNQNQEPIGSRKRREERKGVSDHGGEMYAQASSWTEEDMRRLNGAARAASDRRPDLGADEAMGGAAGFWGTSREYGCVVRSGERG